MTKEAARSARRALTDAIGRLLDLHQLSRPGEEPSRRRLSQIDIIADGLIIVSTVEEDGQENRFSIRINKVKAG